MRSLETGSGTDTEARRFDAATLRRLAVRAEADPRSVKKEILHPGSVRGMSGQRIRRVLQREIGDAAE